MRVRLALFCALLLSFLLLFACAPQKRIVIQADGTSRVLASNAATVRQALDEAGIRLGPLDRVEPDLWVPTERSTTIVVTRVAASVETETRPIPFPRQTVRDEALPEGEARLVQLGVNGQEVVTYRVRKENDNVVAREIVLRQTIEQPRQQIVLVGARGMLPSVPVTGTIAYISNGNAWVIQEASGAKRPLTLSGDLDGRVFALSPDGKRLLFSRRASVGGAAGLGGPLNSLWVIDTSLIGESPRPLNIEGVLWSEWAPDGQRIAYSSGERTGGAPGWKARNDLWLAALERGKPRQIVPPSTSSLYSWWGSAFAWSPSGQYIAYATADEIGIIVVSTGERRVLRRFTPFHTYAEWVWTPEPNWSADGRLLAVTLHGPAPRGERPEDSPAFDVWALDITGKIAAPLVEATGMWSAPRWSPDAVRPRLAFAWAHNSLNSQDSQYDLYLMDSDGSNKQKVFPMEGDHGVISPEMVWSPRGTELVVVQAGNLYLVDLKEQTPPRQLTADGNGSHVRWAR